MSTELAVQKPNQFALSREMDGNTWNAIKEIYDGASDEKVALVIDYCKARKLDPLKKPVHIVPVWSNRRKMMVETLWPSVSEVRITAMRTGAFVRQDATVFGPDITRKVGNVEITFPEFAMVTVYRLVAGEAQAFHGPKARWLETYSNRGKDDASPNAMWTKRPYGQLEKCAEAAALRRAFPEEGSYTAEEMHGKDIDEGVEEGSGSPENVTPQAERPAPKPRAARGAAGAKSAEVVVTAEEQKQAEPEPVKPVENIQAAMEARQEKVTATEKPEPVVVRAFLQDNEKLNAQIKIETLAPVFMTVSGNRTPCIKATTSGAFAGEIRSSFGVASKDGKIVEIDPLFTVGKTVAAVLVGKKSTAPEGNPNYGKVLVWIESAAAVQAEEVV